MAKGFIIFYIIIKIKTIYLIMQTFHNINCFLSFFQHNQKPPNIDQAPINKKPGLRDRSITGMLNYWRLIKQDALAPLDQTPYDQYWSEYVREH